MKSLTWVWLSSPVLDFGGSRPGRDGDAETVWVHADPLGALGLEQDASPGDAHRAYRRMALRHHPDVAPDDPDASERFESITQAARSAQSETEVTVEPTVGAWWKFSGFAEPDPFRRAASAVAGLTFELHDLRGIPRPDAEETIKVTYGGRRLDLNIAYTDSRLALPVLLARLQHAAESTFLFAVCVTAIPVIAFVLGLVAYLVWNLSVLAFWFFVSVTLLTAYTAFAVTLARTGRRISVRRRAVLRTRTTVASLRSLATGRKP